MGQVGLEWRLRVSAISVAPGETDMLMRNSNNGTLRDLRHRQQCHHVAAPMGQVGMEWTVAGFRRFLDAAQRDRYADARQPVPGQFEVYDIRNNQITSAAPVGQVGLGMVGRGLRRFLRQRQRDRHADAQQQYRRIRDLRHQQQQRHFGGASMGQVGLEWSVAGFGPINGAGDKRHADAQQQYWLIRDLRHQQQHHHLRRQPWVRSAWNGRSRASPPPRHLDRPRRTSNSYRRWRLMRRAPRRRLQMARSLPPPRSARPVRSSPRRIRRNKS